MKKRLICFAFSLFFLLSVSSCGQQESACSVDLFAMNTTMSLTIYGEQSLLETAKTEIRKLESLFSATDPNSEIFALNQGNAQALSAPVASLLSEALSLCQRTDGALDITVYPLICAWGFPSGEYRVPSATELQNLLLQVNYKTVPSVGERLQLPEGVQIDFGSVAKGYTADCLQVLLQESGVQSALLNLGGNIQAIGTKPNGEAWKIGIRNPNGQSGDLAATLTVSDCAVVTSGGYERNFEQDGVVYHHILDPKTGYPAKTGLASVTVVAKSGLLADALSTALYVMGLEQATAHWRIYRDFEAVFITEDGAIFYTEGLESDLSVLLEWERTVLHP